MILFNFLIDNSVLNLEKYFYEVFVHSYTDCVHICQTTVSKQLTTTTKNCVNVDVFWSFSLRSTCFPLVAWKMRP